MAFVENMHTCLHVLSVGATHKNNRFSISAIFSNYYPGSNLICLCHQGWRTRNSEEAKRLSMGFVKIWVSERVLPTQGHLSSAHASVLRGQFQLLGIFLCQRPEWVSTLEAHIFIQGVSSEMWNSLKINKTDSLLWELKWIFSGKKEWSC